MPGGRRISGNRSTEPPVRTSERTGLSTTRRMPPAPSLGVGACRCRHRRPGAGGAGYGRTAVAPSKRSLRASRTDAGERRQGDGRGATALRHQVPNAPHVLREYSVIADGLRGGVIGPRGNLAWLCFPAWDSPTVFDTLVGGSGTYDLHPCEPFVWGGYYEDGTLIWRDRWVTESGAVVECRAALSFPGDERRAVILRRLHVLHGAARFRAFLRPVADYGERAFRAFSQTEDGYWVARSGDTRLRWSGRPATTAKPRRAPFGLVTEFNLEEGDRTDLVLEIGLRPLPPRRPTRRPAGWPPKAAGGSRSPPMSPPPRP